METCEPLLSTRMLDELWARVRILLDDGNLPAATETAISASALTRWATMRWQLIGGPRIYDHPMLPTGWMWLEPPARRRDSGRVLVGSDTIEEFCLNWQLYRFAGTAIGMMGAPGFRRFDPDSWRLLSPATPG